MRSFIFDSIYSVREKFLGPAYRNLGKKLYVLGTKLHNEQGTQDRLVPSLRKLTHSGYQPEIQKADFIAPNATIIGQVNLGYNSSVWYGATIIGTNPIQIGDDSVIQDRVHISRNTKVGNSVFIGPNSILQGSEIKDNAFVSMGTTIRHATVESGSLVAAGAVIEDNIVIKEGEVWAGNPGKFLRYLTAVERQILQEHLEQMKELALVHNQQTEKNKREVISGIFEPYDQNNFEQYLKDPDYKFEYDEIDEEFAERRSVMKDKMYAPMLQKDFEGYEYNISHMGEKFNVGFHEEEFRKVATKIKEKGEFQKDSNPWKQPF